MANRHKRPSYRAVPEVQTPVVTTPDTNTLPLVDVDTVEQPVNQGPAVPRLKGKLGGNDEWLQEQLAAASKPNDPDFLNQWTASNATSLVTPEQTTDIRTQSDEPEPEETVAFDYAAFSLKHDIPEYWTQDHIDQWIVVNGYNSGKTERGNFVVDPTRWLRGIGDWPLTELLDGFESKLSDVDEGRFGEMAIAYRRLVVVDAAWSSQDLIDYLVQKLEPAKTSNGAWRNDVTRVKRSAVDWSTQELIAWALGEIRAAGLATELTVSQELNKRLDLGVISNNPKDVITVYKRLQSKDVIIVGEQPTAPTPTVPDTDEPVVEPILPGLTNMNAAYLKTQTERYLKACAPGTPITLEKGTIEQRQLDNLFRYILKLEDPVAFGSALTYFRDFYAKHRLGLFEPTYASRFTGTLRTDGYLQETHVNLLEIFYVYTDPNKAARKQIDLPFLLRNFPVEKQSLLLEFFQRYC